MCHKGLRLAPQTLFLLSCVSCCGQGLGAWGGAGLPKHSASLMQAKPWRRRLPNLSPQVLPVALARVQPPTFRSAP